MKNLTLFAITLLLLLSGCAQDNGVADVFVSPSSEGDRWEPPELPDFSAAPPEAKPDNGTEEDFMEIQAPDSRYTVSIDRTDKSIFTDKGQQLADIYFELPILSGDTEGVPKINTFYEKWCEEWLNDENIDFIFAKVDEFIENNVEEYILPPELLTHSFNSTVTLLDQNTISIFHVSMWYGGGAPSHSLYGNTFNLKTGELVESPYDINDLDFREKLQKAAPNAFHNYKENAGAFFLDKNFVYIITHEYRGNVIKWNGKTGEDFKAEQEFDFNFN